MIFLSAIQAKTEIRHFLFVICLKTIIYYVGLLFEVSHQLNEKLKFYECNSATEQSNLIETSTEGRYDILQNAEGKVMIIINARKSEPYEPRLVYDGDPHALLYRNRSSAVLLDSINIKARSILKEQESVYITELIEEDVYREYTVAVRIVKNLESLSV